MKPRQIFPLLLTLALSLSCLASVSAASVKSPKRPASEIRLALPPLPEMAGEPSLYREELPAQFEPIPALETESPTGPLTSAIDAIVKKKALQATQWSILISDLQQGETLYSYNSNGALLPASNRKLFATALALDQLGPQYRFATNLYLAGRRDSIGRFKGDLLVVASGDPTFSARWSGNGRPDARFREWADELIAQGVKYIQGNVIIDVSGFDPAELYPSGWNEEQLTLPFSAPSGAFSFNENQVSVIVSPGKGTGAPCRVRLEPTSADFRIVNTSRTAGAKYALGVSRRPNEHTIEVRGSLPLKSKPQRVNLAVANPASFAGNALLSALKDKGIRVVGELKMRTNQVSLPEDAVLAVVSRSAPLSEILKEINQNSNNFMAEQVYRAVALEKRGLGSYANAHAVEREFLNRIGVDAAGQRLEDGCGLSRLNQMSATTFVQLLQAMDRHPYGDVFKESLSVSGQSGTLRRRLGEPGLRGKMIGKTGFLKGVSCLSGYLSCPNGSQVALSILTNFPGGAWPQMQAQEAICKAVVDRLSP